MKNTNSRSTSSGSTPGPGGHEVRSDDGNVVFRLVRTPTGLFIERVELRSNSTRVSRSAVFQDMASVKRWLDDDPARFTYPLVCEALRRHCEALFGPET